MTITTLTHHESEAIRYQALAENPRNNALMTAAYIAHAERHTQAANAERARLRAAAANAATDELPGVQS